MIEYMCSVNLLSNIADAISNIKSLQNPATRYVYLERLIKSLPLNSQGQFDTSFYAELQTLEDYTAFQEHINDLQSLLHDLQKNWLKNARNSAFNHMVLSVISLQMDTHLAISKQRELPSFMPFTEDMMKSLTANHKRDPFVATNHPDWDQRVVDLMTQFQYASNQSEDEYYAYFKNLLATEPLLNAELHKRYQLAYGSDVSDFHKKIREKGLEVLYLISLHLDNTRNLETKFDPIINKIRAHLEYESSLRRMINPFLVIPRATPQGSD